MKKYVFIGVLLFVAFLLLGKEEVPPLAQRAGRTLGRTASYREIKSNVKKGENLYDIFRKNNLDIDDLFQLKQASKNIHRLGDISVGNPYTIFVDEEERVSEFTYKINDEDCVTITRTDHGYCATKTPVAIEKREIRLGGIIRDNLISSLGEDAENIRLALKLSDIFAWDIDFTTDLRKGDTFKLVAEGLYSDGHFVKYGEILFAEFTNDGNTYRAYRFEYDGNAGYYDENGKSFRKAFLKAPLNFRRISSLFARKRFHPILKIYRPHHGIDYAAQTGTPVVSVGEGTVAFSGYKGQYGKLVIVRHANRYSTYYGHLSRIPKGIRKGVKVEQGGLIGYVGSTGLASGPHLHYEMRIANRPMNPMAMKTFAGEGVSERLSTRFTAVVADGNSRFASIEPSPIASSRNRGAVPDLSSPDT